MIIYKVFVPLKLILIFVSYSVQIFIQEKVLILFQVFCSMATKVDLFALNIFFKFSYIANILLHGNKYFSFSSSSVQN
jgi:hypothetical protein